MMVTSAQALAKYGDPHLERAMVLFDVPAQLELYAIPRRVYCNRDLAAPLHKALKQVVAEGLAEHIKTWDGCFQIRQKRAGHSLSLHCWGLAVDFNAAWNRMGHPSTQHPRIVEIFESCGFAWGGRWSGRSCDPMHFQLAKLP
jgi:hypothetical protein